MNTDASAQTLHARVADSFARQGMMQHLGAQLRRVEPGWSKSGCPIPTRSRSSRTAFTAAPWARWPTSPAAMRA